ncbi:DUF6968 family protein [Phenylobacterium deserti]|uniref:DUF6968 domain-containing protein n=1 Tax=Phenylobacterium deserti TaxID=1914756 RepID=A0A328A9Z7_9CAUL|nr:hypothetical protein [Phenylobacterium deserti]RAK51460.1 hypothetical protein DJ018_16115 [Phenylobacterium deserti]
MTTPAIAERIFESPDGPVRLQIFPPQPDGQDWRCDYEIEGLSGEGQGHGMGVDGLQALYNALQGAHIKLLMSEHGRTGRLTWLEQTDLTLPLPAYLTADDVRASPPV